MPIQPTAPTTWTPERVHELIEESRHWPRYECIEGELLVTAAPRLAHQVAHSRLFAILHAYVERGGLGLVLSSPSELVLDASSLVQPDLFVIPPSVRRPIPEWKAVTELLLAVEILSPSTASRDRGIKRLYYQRERVPEYWIVDLDARLVERWRPADDRPEVLRHLLVWQPAAQYPPLEIELGAMFDDVERWAGEPDE